MMVFAYNVEMSGTELV